MSDVPPYTTVVQQLGACSAIQISGFITACEASPQTPTACNNWQDDAANAACDICLFDSPVDAAMAGYGGAMLIDAAGTEFLSGNSPGCIALKDTANGPACATNLEPLIQCEDFACDSCATQTDFDTCLGAVQTGACSTYFKAEQSSCATDLADGGVYLADCANDSAIINVICGTGM
jgi:hypothetical protein